LAGSLLSIIETKKFFKKIKFLGKNYIWQLISISLIITPIIFFSQNTTHPSIFTLIPVIGTLMVLCIDSFSLKFPLNILTNKQVVLTGMISYSLYLWHYPFIVFSGLLNINELSNFQKIFIIIAVYFLSLISWKFIENPFRNQRIINNKNFIYFIMFFCSLIIIFSFKIITTNGFPNRFTDQELSLIDYQPKRGAVNFECRKRPIENPCTIGNHNSTNPDIALLGDSHAETLTSHLDAYLQKIGKSAKLYYKAGCPFIFDVESIFKNSNCASHNKKVFDMLIKSKIKNVIINDRGSNYINGLPFNNYEGGIEFKMIENKPSKLAFDVVDENNSNNFGKKKEFQRVKKTMEKFEFTIKKLIENGIDVFYISPIPSVGWDAPKIVHNKLIKNKLPFTTSLQAYLDYHSNFFISINKIAKEHNNFTVIFPHKALCNESTKRCNVHLDNKILYTDNDHLSVAGVDLLFKQIESYLNFDN